MRRLIASIFVFLTAGTAARAAYPLVVDDAAIHPTGESEWVVSADALRLPTLESLAANFALAVGLGPRLEGSLGLGYGLTRARHPAETPTTDGPLDLTLGLKIPLVSEDAAPFALSLSVTSKLPTASVPLGTGLADLNLLAIATRNCGDVSFDLNAGYTWTAVGRRSERAGDAWFLGSAVRWQVRQSLMIFAETAVLFPTDGVTPANGTVRCGGQLELRRGVFLGGAIGTGYGRDGVEALGSLGFTFIY